MKKIFLLILTLALVGTLITGCSSSSSSKTTEATQDVSSTNTAESQSASTTPTSASELVLTVDELAQYNGKDGAAAYIAVDGIIYDVSNVSKWKNGEHNGMLAGNDLTTEIQDLSPHGKSVLENLPVVGKLAA